MSDGAEEARRARGVTCAIMAFNEEATLETAVGEVRDVLRATGRPHEIIIVDDGSIDRTGEIADELAARWSDPVAESIVRVVHHGKNRGPGSAIVTGLLEARHPLYTFHPADNQVDFAEVARGLESLDAGCDIVVGQRSDRRDYSPLRMLASHGYIALAHALFGLSGYRDFNFVYLWRTDVVRRMVPFHTRGVFLCTEVLVRARDGGSRIATVEATYRPRVAGVSTVARPQVIADTFRQMMLFWSARLLDRTVGRQAPEATNRR